MIHSASVCRNTSPDFWIASDIDEIGDILNPAKGDVAMLIQPGVLDFWVNDPSDPTVEADGYDSIAARPCGLWRRAGSLGSSFLNVQSFGAVSSETIDQTSVFERTMDAAQTGDVIFVPPGTYILNSLVVDKDVSFWLMPGARLKHRAAASSTMIFYSVDCTGFFQGGILDGNKTQNTAVANWNDTLHIRGTCEVTSVRFENFVRSGLCSYQPGNITVSACKFLNGAEHHINDDTTLLTVGIRADISTGVTSENLYFTVTNSLFLQDNLPVVDRASPGGAIFAGSHANNAWVVAKVVRSRFYRVGQDYLTTHVGCVDLYENTKDSEVIGCLFKESQYNPIKGQNSLNPKIIGNTVREVTTTLTEASGGAGILMDINRAALGAWYGGGLIAFNTVVLSDGHATDAINGIEVGGRNFTDGIYNDAKVIGNAVVNAKGRAFYMGNAGGNTTVASNDFSGWGKTAGEGAVEFEAIGGNVFKNDNVTKGLTNGTGSHGLFQRDSLVTAKFYEKGEHYIASGAGFTAAVYGEHLRLSLDGCQWNGNGGNSFAIGGATGGAVTAFLFMTPSCQVISGASAITWSKVTLFDGYVKLAGIPEAAAAASPGAEYYDTTSGALFRKNTGTGNTGWRPVETNGMQFISSATYTVLLTDGTIFANATGAAQTYTLPTASSCPGKRVTIVKYDASANTVTIGGTEGPDIVLTTQFDAVELRCTSISWVPLNYA